MEKALADTFRAHFRATLRLLCHFAPWEQIKAWVHAAQHELDAASLAQAMPVALKPPAAPRSRRPPRIPGCDAAAVQSPGNGSRAEGKGNKPRWQHHKRRGGRNRGQRESRHRGADGAGGFAHARRMPLFDAAADYCD